MNKKYKNNPFINELKRDYKKAREKRDFIAMREIYTELWIRDRDMPFPDEGKEEIVFFAEISEDNSVTLPHELSYVFGKKCYVSLFDERINISLDKESDIIEDYLKRACLEFTKIMLKDSFKLSPSALSDLKVKSGDILRIELSNEEFGIELNIYNEADNLRFRLKD